MGASVSLRKSLRFLYLLGEKLALIRLLDWLMKRVTEYEKYLDPST